MQIVFLQEMSKSVFWEKGEKYFALSSAEILSSMLCVKNDTLTLACEPVAEVLFL